MAVAGRGWTLRVWECGVVVVVVAAAAAVCAGVGQLAAAMQTGLRGEIGPPGSAPAPPVVASLAGRAHGALARL